MPKFVIVFLVGSLFSFILQFLLGGDGVINYQNIVIKINLSDLMIMFLLLSNLIAVLLLIKRKK